MSQPIPRVREWPAPDLNLPEAVLSFFEFLHATAVNKVAGLSEEQARSTPLASSPAVSPLGLVKHLTAVQRQHFQIHVGGLDLPTLWNADDTEEDFRLADDETIASVISSFDDEWALSRLSLTRVPWDTVVHAYDDEVLVSRLVVDVLQESARHLGQLDVVRELIDGSTGE